MKEMQYLSPLNTLSLRKGVSGMWCDFALQRMAAFRLLPLHTSYGIVQNSVDARLNCDRESEGRVTFLTCRYK